MPSLASCGVQCTSFTLVVLIQIREQIWGKIVCLSKLPLLSYTALSLNHGGAVGKRNWKETAHVATMPPIHSPRRAGSIVFPVEMGDENYVRSSNI